MAKGYWIATVEVNDPDAYKEYVAANGPVFAKWGARFLVRAGRHEVVEGRMNSRNVVLEFDSYDKALACYNSPEYQDAMKLRLPASEGNLVIVEGYGD